MAFADLGVDLVPGVGFIKFAVEQHSTEITSHAAVAAKLSMVILFSVSTLTTNRGLVILRTVDFCNQLARV